MNEDAFISYARHDNEPYGVRGTPWITKTVKLIEQSSGRTLGKKLVVFFDEESLQDEPVQPPILDSAKTSCVFVAFLSPAYFISDWTIEEMQARITCVGCQRILLVAIGKYQYSISEYISGERQKEIKNVLECLLQLKVERFFEGNHLLGTPALNSKGSLYHRKIDDIAAKIVRHVKTCEQAPAPILNIVYLSIVPSSLSTQRQAIANELKSRKITFSPLDNLTQKLPQVDPQGRIEFFSKDCKLFVLLLDKESCDTDYAYLQYRAAIDNHIPVLLWRAIPPREIDHIHDERYKTLLQKARGGRIENFISTVIRKAQAMDKNV